jgi:SsrA-binding protein
MHQQVNIKNKKATFEYELLEKYITGIQLLGTEIKSVRQSKVSLAEAYCNVIEGELYILNMDIAEYSHGSFYNHQSKRTRKLLLTKKELAKIRVAVNDKGITIIPLQMFISERGFAKLEIAVARGKKIHDKRESLKEKDVKREMDRYKK